MPRPWPGRQGRVMAVPLHPFLTGQAHRIRYLHDALSHIAGHQGSWLATGSEIVDYYRSDVKPRIDGPSGNPQGTKKAPHGYSAGPPGLHRHHTIDEHELHSDHRPDLAGKAGRWPRFPGDG